MSTYSYGQLEGLWINAGGSPALAPLMAAIALAESGGDPTAENKTDNSGRQTSWGLWQISNGTHNEPVPGILDPETNAQQAVKKYKSQGLRAWGTYTSGAYQKYMKNNVDPITSGLPTGSTPANSTAEQTGIAGDVGGAIGSGLAKAFTAVFEPFIKVTVWGMEALIGGAMIVAGFLIVVSQSQTGKNVQAKAEKTAAMVAAPEAAPELEAAQTANAAPPNAPKQQGFAKSGPKVNDWIKPDRARVAHSPEEFRRIRQSGYTGPIRHDYKK